MFGIKAIPKIFPIEVFLDSTTGKVVKNSAGKVMKPEGWTPPDLTNFV